MTNTVTLHFTDQGQGTPLILLHGFPFNGTIWQQQARALSDHCRIILPDLRGHGQSPAPEGVYHMELMARDVLQTLDSLDIEKAVIMGHSMGGYIALAAWRLAPQRFQALGLISSHALPDTDEGRQARHKLAEEVFATGSTAVAESMQPRLFAPGLSPDEPFIEQVHTMMLNTKPLGLMGALRGMAARPDSTPLLPEISVPVLIIVGDSDQIIPLQRAEMTAAPIPNATLVTIENAGHMPMLEQPHATALAIRNFLLELNPYK
jgi:pimeloyl-ACP methyl ester carboxylesterase